MMDIKIIIGWLLVWAIMFGWNELENTNGDYVNNFLRGAWVGVLLGIVVGFLVFVVVMIFVSGSAA